jgi:hypothetical protein
MVMDNLVAQIALNLATITNAMLFLELAFILLLYAHPRIQLMHVYYPLVILHLEVAAMYKLNVMMVRVFALPRHVTTLWDVNIPHYFAMMVILAQPNLAMLLRDASSLQLPTVLLVMVYNVPQTMHAQPMVAARSQTVFVPLF